MSSSSSSSSSTPLRYLIVTLEGAGNQPPMFGIGQQLQQAGHTVIVAGFGSQQERVKRAGLQFALLEQSNAALMAAVGASLAIPFSMQQQQAGGKQPDMGVFVQHCMCSAPLIQHDLPALLKQHNIDRVILDMLMFSAIALAEADPSLQAKSYVILHTAPHAVFPADGTGFGAITLPAVNMVRAALQLPPLTNTIDIFAWCAKQQGGPRGLVTSIEQLDPTPELLPANTFDFIGQRGETHPAPTDDWQAGAGWKADDSRPLILVSFHTSAMLDQRSRIQRTLQALADPAPYRILATTSTVDTTDLAIPANAVVRPFIPHHHVLPHVSAVVTHAGHGTVLGALEHGLPLLCLPNPMADQPVLAARISQLGAGLALDGESASVEEIRGAVDVLVKDGRFREAARGLAKSIKEASNKPLLC